MDKAKADSLINEGAAVFGRGDISLAIKYFLEALKHNPNSVEANFNLGLCYQGQKNFSKAIYYYEKTLLLNERDFDALYNLGNLYFLNRTLERAVVCYRSALEIQPKNKILLKNYSFALANLGASLLYKDPERALKLLLEAHKISPKVPSILYNVSNAYQAMGRSKESLSALKKTIKIDPEFEQAYGQLYLRLRSFACWDEAKKIFKKMKKLSDLALALGKLTAETPFVSVCTFQDPKRNFEIAKSWAKQDKELVADLEFKPKYFPKKSGEPIKVGYLSYDFHDHATLHLLMGVLRLHNQKKFKIYAYSYGFPSDSSYRRDAQKYVSVFRDIRLNSDLEAAKIINKDKIDILVDLKGHTSGCRLGIMALRPAPVSVTWLGFPGTTGADYIDYIITDRIVTPPTEAKYYSEKIVYLPHAYQPTDNQQAISDRRFTRRNLGLPSDPDIIVFSSFNQTYKIEPEAFTVWMNILKRVPKSVLWLYVDNEMAAGNLRKEAKKRGIEAKRIIFAHPLPKPEHLKRIALADLALDTFTYNGHTTTSDCLWAGVPVITLKGNHFASRVSASLLTAMGMKQLITSSKAEYERLAVELANNPKKLNALCYSLLSNRLTAPLFDTQRFTGDLENIYEEIYLRFKQRR